MKKTLGRGALSLFFFITVKMLVVWIAVGLFLLIIIGIIMYHQSKKPAPTPLEPSVKGSDTFNVIQVTEGYEVKKEFATISPPYIYRLGWNITSPVPIDGGRLSITIDDKTTSQEVAGSGTIDLNPLLFARSGVKTYDFSAILTFKHGGKNYKYIFKSPPKQLTLPYLITDVSSFFTSSHSRPAVYWDHPPIYPYVNSWGRFKITPNAVLLSAIAISATDNSATPGLIAAEGSIYRDNVPHHKMPFLIPKLGISPPDFFLESLTTAQAAYPSLLLIQPLAGYYLIINPSVKSATLNVELTTGNGGTIRISGLADLS